MLVSNKLVRIFRIEANLLSLRVQIVSTKGNFRLNVMLNVGQRDFSKICFYPSTDGHYDTETNVTVKFVEFNSEAIFGNMVVKTRFRG